MELTDEIISKVGEDFQRGIEELLLLHPKISPEDAKYESTLAMNFALYRIRIFISKADKL